MAFEQKDNSGALFVNDKKDHEKSPDRNGSIRVAGIDYWLSGWLKVDKNGKQYLSLAVNEKKPRNEATAKVDKARAQADFEKDPDPIPF